MRFAERWREPTRDLPLRWGHYSDRYLAGIVLIVAGGLHLAGSNNYTLGFLLIGTVVHAIGWSIMPARGWRRILVVAPATAQIWLLLTGPLSVWTFTIPYVCWLIVRHRPWRSYVTVIFPILNGFLLPHFFIEYSGMPLALAISMCVFIGSAWVARAIAMTRGNGAGT
jgi:hypothetical protein